MDFEKGKGKTLSMAHELGEQCKTGSPSVFLLASAYLDYLSKLVSGSDKKRDGYVTFIEKWLAEVREEYRTFRYKDGEQDLPQQMYHVLRCGIVHSFSLIPDQQALARGGRNRSIVLCHRKESDEKDLPHLSNYTSDCVPDAAVFVAEDFTEDIENVAESIFKTAEEDTILKRNIEGWLAAHPPISAGF